VTLIFDPAADLLILDPLATDWLVLVIEPAGAASLRGCLNVSAAMAGGVDLSPGLRGQIGVSVSAQGGVELAPSLLASFVVAPTFEGALEIGVMSCEGELSAGDLLIENSTDVALVGVKPRGGDFINDATVTMTLRNSAGVVVVGAENLPLEPVEESDGEYLGQLPDSLDLTENGEYKLKVRAVKAGVAVGTWTADLVAKVRSASHCS